MTPMRLGETLLHARVDDKEILRGVNLKVNAGEVHAIMGPNGSGKSDELPPEEPAPPLLRFEPRHWNSLDCAGLWAACPRGDPPQQAPHPR